MKKSLTFDNQFKFKIYILKNILLAKSGSYSVSPQDELSNCDSAARKKQKVKTMYKLIKKLINFSVLPTLSFITFYLHKVLFIFLKVSICFFYDFVSDNLYYSFSISNFLYHNLTKVTCLCLKYNSDFKIGRFI